MPPRQDLFDVIIVGSGAGGGMAAYMLTRAGARVAVLEAGPMWWPDQDSAMFTWNNQSPRRGAGTRLRPFGEFDAGDGGWDIEGEPSTVAAGQQFDWYRGRMLGGRTNHWGRISLRFGPLDFRRGRARRARVRCWSSRRGCRSRSPPDATCDCGPRRWRRASCTTTPPPSTCTAASWPRARATWRSSGAWAPCSTPSAATPSCSACATSSSGWRPIRPAASTCASTSPAWSAWSRRPAGATRH